MEKEIIKKEIYGYWTKDSSNVIRFVKYPKETNDVLSKKDIALITTGDTMKIPNYKKE